MSTNHNTNPTSNVNTRRRRYVAIGCVAIAALSAWLGCNSLLDISDPVFVPLADAGEDAGTLPDGGIIQTGPVIASRRSIRVPRGERSSFFINVDPSGKSGAVVLTAKPLVTQDVGVFQVPDGTNRFKVTLTAKAEAAVVDEKLLMQAVTDTGAIIGSTEIRVLVGLPGTLDISFGKNGVSTTVGAPAQVQFAVVGTNTLFVAEDNTVQELADDGASTRPVFSLDTKGKNECGISAIAADPGTILVSGYCPQGNEDFLAQGARNFDGGTTPIEVVPQQDLFKITRFADAGWYLALSPDSGTEVHAWPVAPAGLSPAGGFAFAPITVPTLLVPGDGGLMVVGREEDPAHITEVARLAGTPLALPTTTYGDGGVAAIDIAEGPPTLEPAVGAATGSGAFLVATPLAGKVLIQGFSTKGFATNGSSLDGFTMVAVAADRRDRFVVAAVGADGKAGIRRFKADGALDDVFGTNPSVNACQHAQIAVDDDGMIVVYCPASPNALVYRVWP